MLVAVSNEPKSLNLIGNSYFGEAFGDAEKLISNAETTFNALNLKFDTMAAIGVSGLLVMPLLARHFNVNMLALRKPKDDSHSYQKAEGTLGKRWILVDDFVATGNTIASAQSIVSGLFAKKNFHSKYVGTYTYNTDNRFSTSAFYLPGKNLVRQSYYKLLQDSKVSYVDAYAYTRAKDIYLAGRGMGIEHLKTYVIEQIEIKGIEVSKKDLAKILIDIENKTA